MAIGKGSMARAAKVAKPVEAKEAEVKVEVKAEVKTEAKAAPAAKKAPVKKAPAKKAPVKKAEAPKAAVVTPTAQVMDMISKDRVEIGDEMPVYFY